MRFWTQALEKRLLTMRNAGSDYDIVLNFEFSYAHFSIFYSPVIKGSVTFSRSKYWWILSLSKPEWNDKDMSAKLVVLTMAANEYFFVKSHQHGGGDERWKNILPKRVWRYFYFVVLQLIVVWCTTTHKIMYIRVQRFDVLKWNPNIMSNTNQFEHREPS